MKNMKNMWCNFCGKQNTEVVEHKFKPVNTPNWLAVIFTAGLIKHQLCQSCASKIFRSFKKEV